MIYVWIGVGIVIVLIFAFVAMKRGLGSMDVEELLPYNQKKNFFSQSEWQFFKILEASIDHKTLTVFPKVRLADFVEVADGEKEYQKWLNGIKSKHVDFLIWNTQTSSLVLGIELDGNSHNSQRAQDRDIKKDNIFKAIGLELVRVKVGTDFQSEIQKVLQKLQV